MIELDGMASKIPEKAMVANDKLSSLFSDINSAVCFITRRMGLPEHITTDASLAALKTIEHWRTERYHEAAQRHARNK